MKPLKNILLIIFSSSFFIYAISTERINEYVALLLLLPPLLLFIIFDLKPAISSLKTELPVDHSTERAVENLSIVELFFRPLFLDNKLSKISHILVVPLLVLSVFMIGSNNTILLFAGIAIVVLCILGLFFLDVLYDLKRAQYDAKFFSTLTSTIKNKIKGESSGPENTPASIRIRKVFFFKALILISLRILLFIAIIYYLVSLFYNGII